MNSFQRTAQEQADYEASFSSAITAAKTSRCSTPDSGSDCSITDDDAEACGFYATINAAPSVISGGRHGGAPYMPTRPKEIPSRRSSSGASGVHHQQPICGCGQDVVFLPCGHLFCVLCCLRLRGGSSYGYAPSAGICVCAELYLPCTIKLEGEIERCAH